MNKIPSIEEILETLDEDIHEKILAVYNYSKGHLKDVNRRSGESYFKHGMELAKILTKFAKEPELYVTAMLHDILLHKDGERLLQRAPVNSEEREMIKKMCSLRNLHISKKTKDLDHVISTFTDDSRILLLRMIHRLNDIRNFKRFDKELQQKIAEETLHMYTSIADRLGFHAWRYEMEDVCFKSLYPDLAKNLQKQFDKMKPIDYSCLSQTKNYLKKEFEKKKIKAHINYRIKRLYSTYRKMILKQRRFEELTDRLAVRIIVPKVEDCYRVLGLVHRVMHPIAGKLKDYIGAPKENGYRSIHTVVYPLPGITEQPIEIQIRTQKMHYECEYGFAAHYKYKDFNYTLTSRPARVGLFRNLEMLKRETRYPWQFKHALRNYFNENRLVIFDEKNNLYHLKKPSTAMDFALIIHKEKCKKLKSIKINGREQPFDKTLHDGDVIEVQFGRNITMDREWRSICRQKYSREKIDQFILS